MDAENLSFSTSNKGSSSWPSVLLAVSHHRPCFPAKPALSRPDFPRKNPGNQIGARLNFGASDPIVELREASEGNRGQLRGPTCLSLAAPTGRFVGMELAGTARSPANTASGRLPPHGSSTLRADCNRSTFSKTCPTSFWIWKRNADPPRHACERAGTTPRPRRAYQVPSDPRVGFEDIAIAGATMCASSLF